ncbi:serine protease [Streptomyces sp. NWU49]|uniref:S8 family peptidase n=1 Tax=Streptomyces sp. NWU49 TaxID=2201153 RepID=UPI000D67E548|nr:S8 family peptidase [Streptomyces sp. NWU49]PWJ02273.1 serine protease [Streptomyces sp. NWU49]
MAGRRMTRHRLAGVGTAILTAVALGAVAALPAAAAPAEGVVLNADGPGAVDGSYIVVLKEAAGFGAASRQGKALVAKFDGEITHTYTAALNGYAVSMGQEEAERLAADPAVKFVVQDQTVQATGTQPAPPSWGLDRIDQAPLPLNGSYTYPDSAGEGVTAYVIDTGVRISHSDFAGRARYGYDAVDGDTIADDGNGHGTHVAGTIAGASHGVAKNADIVAVRVLNNSGSGTTAGVIAGVDWVTANASGPSVANMSLGGGANIALDTAVRNSIASGVTYAVAAGNSNTDASSASPARVTEALTVGSTTNTDARSSFSNYGSVLDVFAPGSSITSAWHTSDSATNTISGTSMAAPHVAGAAALHLADDPTATPEQVASALAGKATYAAVTDPGPGSPNLLLNVGEDGGGAPEPAPAPSGKRFENTTDYGVPDRSVAESPIRVTGVPHNAPANLHVEVDIKHTWSGDLQVDLIAPDGTAYRLKNTGTGGSADNVVGTFPVDASSEKAMGTWKLQVTDAYAGDIGYIDSWALQF